MSINTLTRRYILIAGAGALATAITDAAQAASWPDRPLRLAIGYPPGGSADGVARPLLAPMGKALGQPIVMDYKPGAGGATAAEVVARSTPDGNVIHLIEGGVMTALPHLRKLSVDPVRMLQPISTVAVGGAIIVAHPSLGVKTIEDLVRLAKASPGKVAYGTSGTGGALHLAAEQFQAAAGIKMLHVPYKGGAPAMTDLLGGQIQLLFSSMAPAIPFVKSGKVQALGITSSARSSSLPQIPTVAEQGLPGFESSVWLAVVAPKGLPDAVASKLSAAVHSAVANADTQTEIRAQGYEPVAENPQVLAERIAADSAKWSQVIKAAGITLE